MRSEHNQQWDPPLLAGLTSSDHALPAVRVAVDLFRSAGKASLYDSHPTHVVLIAHLCRTSDSTATVPADSGATGPAAVRELGRLLGDVALRSIGVAGGMALVDPHYAQADLERAIWSAVGSWNEALVPHVTRVEEVLGTVAESGIEVPPSAFSDCCASLLSAASDPAVEEVMSFAAEVLQSDGVAEVWSRFRGPILFVLARIADHRCQLEPLELDLFCQLLLVGAPTSVLPGVTAGAGFALCESFAEADPHTRKEIARLWSEEATDQGSLEERCRQHVRLTRPGPSAEASGP